MPSGYTAPIETGITFEDFVMRCARAMGPLVIMRDDPLDAPIPEKLEPSTFYADAYRQKKARLAEVAQMSDEQCEQCAAAEYADGCRQFEMRRAEAAAEDAKYSAMLKRVEAWNPPTPDHKPLQDFMLQQIRDSMNGDVYGGPPLPRTGEQWRAEAIHDLTRSITYYGEEAAKEAGRTEWRNAWLSALRQSLKP